MLTLLKDDPKLKVVLKEFPILGPGLVEAARVAIAARMQDPTGQKYLALR
jgi:protein-disulfide isomerase